MLKKGLQYYNTLKYLEPVQIYVRLISEFKKRFNIPKLPPIPENLSANLSPKTSFLFHDPWNDKHHLNKGRFTFLNQTIEFGNNINWEPETSLLWKFNLHYFNFLHLLPNNEQLILCSNWIENNELGKGTGWHPYPLSLRLVNWIKADLDDENIQKSIYQQAAYLYRHLEYYHPNNHYLENAKSLLFAGRYFNGAGELNMWAAEGSKILKSEIEGQILEDGCHFELSPMYHAQILLGFLDLINVLPETFNIYSLLKVKSFKMLNFLNSLTHPDGDIAQFNDSTLEIAPSTFSLNHYTNRIGFNSSEIEQDDRTIITCSYTDSGFYVIKESGFYLAIKGGKIGPDNIPAHAHSDIFSYELSYKGQRFIVDSGNYNYEAGDIRNYCRSTRAHNTVMIENIDQSENWDCFRVARRYHPYDVNIVDNGGNISFYGKFRGYSELIGDNLIHQRSIETSKDSSTIFVKDTITGSGNHLVESFIHLHPQVKLTVNDNYLFLSLSGASLSLNIKNIEYRIDTGWYCPEFGRKIKNQVIVIYSNEQPSLFEYSFSVNQN